MKNLYIILIFLTLSVHLKAMKAAPAKALNLDSLAQIIDHLNQSEWGKKSCSIIPALTTIALQNSANLIARGYLWAFHTEPEKFFSEAELTSPCFTVSGEALKAALEFEYAPEKLKYFVQANFLTPTKYISNSHKFYQYYLIDLKKLDETKKQLTLKNTRQIKQLNSSYESLKERNLNTQKCFLEGKIKLFFESYNPGLIYTLINHPYQRYTEFSLDNLLYRINNKNSINFTKELKDYALIKEYFDNPQRLIDGSYEKSLTATVQDDSTRSWLINLALVLGDEEILTASLLIQKDNNDMMRDWALYVAKHAPNSKNILIAGCKGLDNASTQEQALMLLEYFLAMPESNADSVKNLNKIYTPYKLANYYGASNNYSKALEFFIAAWNKDFAPDADSLHIIIEYFAQQRIHKHELKQKFSCLSNFYYFMLLIYIERENIEKTQEYLIRYLESIRRSSDAYMLPSCLELILNDEIEFTRPLVKESVMKRLEELLPIAPPETLGNYWAVFFSLKDKNSHEERSNYLSLAAQNGNYSALLIHSSDMEDSCYNNMLLLREYADLVAQNVNSKFSLLQSCIDLISSGQQSCSQQVIMPASNQLIRDFISKWQNMHWKNSDRNELIQDFRTMVLANADNAHGNSNFLHANHGRRKAKYGQCASTFEIGTLIFRAEKILAKLENR